MSNISDIIEKYLIELFSDGNIISISRNELANYFSCAPSQINYVLTTRFTPARGFVIQSRRGGGGYISLTRLADDRDELLTELSQISVRDGLSQAKALHLLARMHESDLLTKREAELLAISLSDKALIAPSIAKDGLRAGIMRSVAAELLRNQKEDADDE